MTLLTAQAAEKLHLPLFTAQAAAAVKDAMPGAEAQIQGTIAVVKMNSVAGAKNKSAPSAHSKAAETLATDGAVFIIRVERYWARQPMRSGAIALKAPAVARTPLFDPAHVKLVWGAYHTSGVQVFEKANLVLFVDISFGERADTAMLQRAYAALTQFATTKLNL
ncbi:MAG: hypothetical protein ABR514_09600 [Chthoniobacterales bacterium]